MADKPSRGLVLYGDGMARFIDPSPSSSSHTHLHSFAARASCGFLSLPLSPPSESEDSRIVREFAELLDACENYTNMSGEDSTKVECQEKFVMPTISERFMGMRAAIITENSSLRSFGGKLGFTMLHLIDLIDSSHPLAESPLDMASGLMKLLGFEGGKTLETSQYDLVFVHIVAGEKSNGEKDVEYVNNLIAKLMHIADSGSEIGSRLHMSLVMSYGTVLENDDSNLSVLITNQDENSDISLLFPRQSYTMKGGHLRKNVRHHCPMLIAQWQNAVTRKDATESFSFKDFKEHGGNLTIPADRFLHEVAFKLWKAPKYGA